MPQVSVAFGAGAFSAKLYIQPGPVGTSVALVQSALGSQDLTTAAVASAGVAAIIVPANQLIVEEVGNFGYESAEASFPIAGSRFSSKVAVISPPSTISLVFPLNPSSATFQLATQSSLSGTDVRTYVVAWLVGANTFLYAFNAFCGATGYQFATGSEAKATISLIPQGSGQYGYSFTPA